MKNHLIISLLILSVGFSQQEYNSNDITEMDNGLWTEKFSDKPITGKVYGYFGEGKHYKKVYIGYIDNGKREGKWNIWYDNGKKKSETTYKDGKGDGLSTDWYENGQKSYEFTFKDGQPDGLWTGWSPDGKEISEFIYKDGQKWDGNWTLWNEKGQKKEANKLIQEIMDELDR